MARVVTPNTGIEIQVRGLANVQAMLAKAADTKEGTKYLQRATAAGGKALKPFLVEAAPYPGLKKAVWIHRASRNRPATVTGHHRRADSFYWHMVVGGTKDHGPKKAHWIFIPHPGGTFSLVPSVRGVKPNPFVARAESAGQFAALAAVDKVVSDYLESL